MKSRRIHRGFRVRAAACVAAIAAMYGTAAAADDAAVSPLLQASLSAASLAVVEHVFWSCDYLAVTRGEGTTPADVCAAVVSELLVRKFHGDAEGAYEWWMQNRPAAHDSMAAADLQEVPLP